MKEKGKWTPHIIAATVLVVFMVLGSACGSTPKSQPEPTEEYYDTSIPEDQAATLFVMPGYIEVIEFDRTPVKWFQASPKSPGMNVIIPAGEHSIKFHYYGGAYGVNFKDKTLNFNTIAGRTYQLVPVQLSGSYIGDSISETMAFTVYEISEKREVKPDEQLLFIEQRAAYLGGQLMLFVTVLDKGTDQERAIYSNGVSGETRIVIPKGEHTIDVKTLDGTYIAPEGEQPRRFNASSEPLRYSLEGKAAGKGKDVKITYILTRK